MVTVSTDCGQHGYSLVSVLFLFLTVQSNLPGYTDLTEYGGRLGDFAMDTLGLEMVSII